MGSDSTIQPYVIKSGDTLSGIADKCGLTEKELLKLNPGLKDPNRIQQGAKINIPLVSDSAIDKPVDSFQKTSTDTTTAKETEPWKSLKQLIENGKEEDFDGAKIIEEKGFLGIKTGTILYTADGSLTYGELKEQLNLRDKVIRERNPKAMKGIDGNANDAIIPEGTVLKFRQEDLPGKPLKDEDGNEVDGFSKSLFSNTVLYRVKSGDNPSDIYKKFEENEDVLKKYRTADSLRGYSETALQPGVQVPLYAKFLGIF